MDTLTRCIRSAQVSILSVGSGDGSQQVSIVKSGHSNITTTFYDGRDQLFAKYPNAKENIQYLESKCSKVLHTYSSLGKFHLILFTFPHTGIPNSRPDSIRSNQTLIAGFLKSASKVIHPSGGEIQITLKTGAPYDQWDVPHLLTDEYNLTLIDTHELNKSIFPGYIHRPTLKHVSSTINEVRDKGAKVYVFAPSPDCRNGSGKIEQQMDMTGTCVTIMNYSTEDNIITDEDIRYQVLQVLNRPICERDTKKSDRAFDVLEIRKQFHSSVPPDTRQLNRVLYKMEADGILKKIPASEKKSSTNKKPLWVLSETNHVRSNQQSTSNENPQAAPTAKQNSALLTKKNSQKVSTLAKLKVPKEMKTKKPSGKKRIISHQNKSTKRKSVQKKSRKKTL